MNLQSTAEQNQLRKSPMAEIIMINTYGANRRWMIPGNREHSHRATVTVEKQKQTSYD